MVFMAVIFKFSNRLIFKLFTLCANLQNLGAQLVYFVV
jgi:hypothetical protein